MSVNKSIKPNNFSSDFKKAILSRITMNTDDFNQAMPLGMTMNADDFNQAMPLGMTMNADDFNQAMPLGMTIRVSDNLIYFDKNYDQESPSVDLIDKSISIKQFELRQKAQTELHHKLKKDIESILKDCKSVGWDGEDAEPIKDIDHALYFLEKLTYYGLINENLGIFPISNDLIYFQFKKKNTQDHIGIYVSKKNEFNFTFTQYNKFEKKPREGCGTYSSLDDAIKLIIEHQ
ncbi:MAG: hypothetical protein ACR2M7_05905 [Bdellovibrionales bacterium]